MITQIFHVNVNGNKHKVAEHTEQCLWSEFLGGELFIRLTLNVKYFKVLLLKFSNTHYLQNTFQIVLGKNI